MGLFGPTHKEQRLAAALAREKRQHECDVVTWTRACRHWISLDLIAERPVSLLSIHVPLGFDIDAEVAAERRRLENRNLLR
jgi:hypothetical protein